MAASVSSKGAVINTPHQVVAVEVSSMEPGVTVNVAHGGPSGAPVIYITHEVITRATSRDVIEVSHLRGSDSLANSTVAVAFDTISGGDLAGAVVRLYCHFAAHASGGLTDVA